MWSEDTVISFGCSTAYKRDIPSDGYPCCRRNVFSVSPARLFHGNSDKNVVNGTHLAADVAGFLEKRRRGLIRFSNQLVQHPILSQETLVQMFLTVPTVSSRFRSVSHRLTTDSSIRSSRFGENRPPFPYRKNSQANRYHQIWKRAFLQLYLSSSNRSELVSGGQLKSTSTCAC